MERAVTPIKFFNCGLDGSVCVALVGNWIGNHLFDWAAYIGVGRGQSDMDDAEYVAQHGCKLTLEEVQGFCNVELPPERYRS